MKVVENCKIKSIGFLADNICDMRIYCPKIAAQAVAGQFVEVYPDNGVNLLARPISICEIDKIIGTIRLVFQIVGKGTKLFSTLKAGDTIRVLGSCGNGYTIPKSVESTTVLVGGGIGIPPLLEAAKHIQGDKIIVLGYRTKPAFLSEEFTKYGEVHICTDDGSEGFKGNTVQFLIENNITGDEIISCGPKIMLKFLAQYAQEKDIPCQVSMEERMACGIGACVGCVVEIKEGNTTVYKKVCKDGPVFDAKEVAW
jgi:dihydroorotate dehydrogenase electron transfer subunit